MEPNRQPVSFLRLFIILLLASLFFLGGIILLADIKCNYDIENWWAPPYPNAETVHPIEYDLFRPRALGTTKWTMRSPDDVETVKQFYRDKRIEALNSDRTRGLAWAESFVRPAENGEGSLIILSSACGT